MIVTGSANGTFVVPGAVTVRQEDYVISDNLSGASATWRPQAITADDLYTNEAFTFPFRGLLSETIRNTYFHVSLWFAMMFLFIAAVVYAIKYLMRKSRYDRSAALGGVALTDITDLERADNWSVVFTSVGTLFGVLGLLTGAVWAKYTWGSYWNWDIKQFTTLIALLIYAGYFVLRAAFPDPEQRARLGAVYNIFAFACLIPLIYILPRLSATSLHPGAEGNPALGGEDLDNTMRMVFYPTIIGWTLFGGWMATIAYRSRMLGLRLVRRMDQSL
jgi:heme exporter protein C